MTEGDSLQVVEEDVPVPWGHISTKCWGQKKNDPVIFIHGIQDNAGSFDRLIPYLNRHYYYICVDLPGHGFSSHFPDGLPPDFMNYISSIHRVVLHFQLRKCVMIGHSVGGLVAAYYTASEPTQVEKLILIEAVSTVPLDNEIFLIRHGNQYRQLIKLEKESAKQTERTFTYEEVRTKLTNERPIYLKNEAMRPIIERSIKKYKEGYKLTVDQKNKLDIRPPTNEETNFYVYKAIHCPVLIILADGSELKWLFETPGYFTKVIDIYSRTHAKSTIVTVVGNHNVHNNDPDKVAPVLNKFLNITISKY